MGGGSWAGEWQRGRSRSEVEGMSGDSLGRVLPGAPRFLDSP